MKNLIFALSILVTSYFVFAEDSYIGRVVKLKGDVLVKTASGTKIILKVGDKLNVGDLLSSGSRSFVKMLMIDDTAFQLGPKSEFAFENFKMKNKNERTATYNLVRGKLRSLFTKKAPKRTLTIKTPNAAMGIRGTEIVSDVYMHNGEVKTDIALLSGKLEVSMKDRDRFFLEKGELIQLARSQGQKVAMNRKKMHKDVLNRLKRGSKKGGDIFLFDARKKVLKRKMKGAEFGDQFKNREVIRELKKEDSSKIGKNLKPGSPVVGKRLKKGLKRRMKLRNFQGQKRIRRLIRTEKGKELLREQLEQQRLPLPTGTAPTAPTNTDEPHH